MENTITTNTEFRVYVACLSSYNNGILHGAWCDAVDADSLNENIQAILKASPMHDAEEWAIHDYEGFGSLYTKLGENPKIETLCKLGEALQGLSNKHDLAYDYTYELGADVLAEFISDFGLDIEDMDDVMQEFENRFQGVHDTFEEFAENLFDELYLHTVPDDVKNYIDYEKFARDLSYDYTEISTGDGNVAVFYNH
jgi:antirestriction protein